MLAPLGCAAAPERALPTTPAAQLEGEERPLRLVSPVLGPDVSPTTAATDGSASDDAIVRIVGDVTCSGTLIAEDLVLTAHHCVSARDGRGRILAEDLDPAEIMVELGGDYLPWAEVRVGAIVAPECGHAGGDGDIAILVLTRKLVGAVTFAYRDDAKPTVGETVTPVGFGRCRLSRPGIQRISRASSRVESVGQGQFAAAASICPGDSGGPVHLEPTDGRKGKVVVGVISASVMDSDDLTAAPSLFTRLDRWRHLFSAARQVADGASPGEVTHDYRRCGP